MDDRLRELMQDLINAINESISDSEAIAKAIEEIKAAGYDVFIILEATIGFNKREAVEEGGPEADPSPKHKVVFKVSKADRKLFEGSGVNLDDEDPPDFKKPDSKKKKPGK